MILKKILLNPMKKKIFDKWEPEINFDEVSIRNKGYKGEQKIRLVFAEIKGFGRYWLTIGACLFGLKHSERFGVLENIDFLDFWFNRFNLYAYLDKQTKDAIVRKQDNGSYPGLRLIQALPVRGQRTRSNSKTVRRVFVRVVIERQGRRRRRHFKNKK